MSTRATGTIAVTSWLPQPFDEPADGPALVRIDVVETFSGDIAGEGRATMLQTLRPDGSASFVAVERVSAVLAGRHGTFVLHDRGTLDAAGHVDGEWFVVPGSGTGGLAGLRGEGGFEAAIGEHASIHLDYWFE